MRTPWPRLPCLKARASQVIVSREAQLGNGTRFTAIIPASDVIPVGLQTGCSVLRSTWIGLIESGVVRWPRPCRAFKGPSGPGRPLVRPGRVHRRAKLVPGLIGITWRRHRPHADPRNIARPPPDQAVYGRRSCRAEKSTRGKSKDSGRAARWGRRTCERGCLTWKASLILSEFP